GIAKVAGGLASKVTKQGSFVGTPEYAAPEQFEQMAPSAATDIFACGGLLYYTLTGKPPVILSRRSDIESSFKEICEQLPPVLIPEQHGQRNQHQRSQLQEIINNTMTRRPEHRWTAQAVIRKLNQLLEGDLPQLKSGNLELTDPVAPQRMNMPSASPTFALSAPPVSDSNSGLGASDSLEAPEDTPVIEFLAAAAVAAAGAAVVAAAVVAAASEASETESEPASPPPPSEPSVETPPPLQAVAAPPEKPSFQRDAEETWAPQVAAQLPDESSAVPVVAGVLGVGAVAFLLAGAVAVLVAACGLWFYTTGPGAIVKPEVAAVWEADADWLSGASRQTAQSVVQDALSGALSGCSHQGALVATVWSVDGKIAHVELDKHWVSAANTGCLVDGLQGIATGVTEGVRIRVAVSLDP
ncbi:MAG: hypothetical protein GWP91_12665, partial [Rhodobacterales bacterium]|nr:hypothetical protein [Rhodobacterales bacterium]